MTETFNAAIMNSGYGGEWANERCRGPYSGYRGWAPKSAHERRNILAPHFPKLDWSHVEPLIDRYRVKTINQGFDGGYRRAPRGEREITLPKDADGGLIVFPKLEAVRKCVRTQKEGWKSINLALDYVIGILREVYPGFNDWTNGNIGPWYERLLDKTATELTRLSSETPGDVHVLPFQAGAMFAGYSNRSSIGHMDALKRHVPAHDFANLCLMVTDPDRFAEGTLFIDCPGSERAPDGDGRFYCAPCVFFHEGKRKLGSHHIGRPRSDHGSSSFIISSE